MTTRADIVKKALSYNGLNNGTGYPGPLNVFEEEVSRPAEFWCGDFVSAIYKMCKLPLPSMQQGETTGFSYVPAAEAAAKSRPGGWTFSWLSQPGDLVIFDWNGDARADHVELVTSYGSTSLYTIGGDSGPSNVDGYQGQGGVHRNVWSAPVSVGNPKILGVVSVEKFVTFTADSTPPPTVNVTLPEIKYGEHGPGVYFWQCRFNGMLDSGYVKGHQLTLDGVCGTATVAALKEIQAFWGHPTTGVVAALDWARAAQLSG